MIEAHTMPIDENDDNITTNADKGMGSIQGRFGINKLYGRASHLKQLMDACLRTSSTSCSPEVVLVVGSSGSGKSSLVQTVIDRLMEDGGFQFISGKFDQLQYAEPLPAIITAFNQYFDDIISRRSAEHVDIIRTDILDAIGDCSGVLTEFFPGLAQILGDCMTTPASVGAKEAQHRFEYLFRLMVRAIATPTNTIVFFLDDLQWADAYSLHLIMTLVTDGEIENFLFLGCFRDDEVDDAHPLVTNLRELEIKSVEITKIAVTDLKREDINALVSETFQMPENIVTPLTNIVHQKTNGNIFRVTQFLQSLHDGGLLQWSSVSNSWEFNIRAIEVEHVPDDSVLIMACKILNKLPENAQHAMKLMSCIGSNCFESTLELFLYEEMIMGIQKGKLVKGADESTEKNKPFSYLDLAVREGFLVKEGSNYKFAHDQIQCATYSLIPEDEKCFWHLHIGHAIWNNVPDKDKDKVLFLSVDQMNCGISSIESEDQRVFLAMLNLRAGERAMSLSTFSSSASYFGTGLKLLSREDHWEKYYDLSLHLYNYYAEAEYCNGNFSEVGQATGVILTEAKSYYDKLRAYLILIKALAAQNKFLEAIDIGVSVLVQLGKQLPSHVVSDKSAIHKSLNKMKATFEGMTLDEFLKLRRMEDSDTLIAMSFMSELLLYTFLTKQDYYVCCINHMMHLTLDYGVCKESCVALAGCSTILFGLGDYQGSECIGRFALGLLEQLDVQECVPRVYAAVYTGILSRLEPSKTVSQKFLHAYKVGMQTGDIQFAMMTAYQYCGYSLCHGGKLGELKRDIEVFETQMIEYKQESNLSAIIPIKHAILHLIHWTDDPSQQVDKFMADAMKLFDEHIENNRLFPASTYCFYCSCVSYIFCNYDFAMDLMKMRRKLNETLCKQFSAYGMASFFDGLVSVALARKTKQDMWIEYAFECLEKTKKSAFNGQHTVLLLETEIAILAAGKKSDTITMYDMAIDAACQNEHIHVQAIANEKAGDFCLSQGDFRSSRYYGEAYRLYLQWGAKAKAEQLIKKYHLDIPS